MSPYIPKHQRALYEGYARPASDEGELNYRLAREIDRFMQSKGASYKAFNAVMGVLSCLSQEFYRRKVAIYEDVKIIENGDVFADSYDDVN